MKFNGLPSKVDRPNPGRITKTITIWVEAMEEDVPIKGNASAHDDETDREQEKWIKHQLKNGNPWAWAHVRLVVEMDGATGSDSLGCCSYHSAEDFCMPGGYFDDMVGRAVEEMLQKRGEKFEENGHGKFFIGTSRDPDLPGIILGPITAMDEAKAARDKKPGQHVYQKIGEKYRYCAV